MTVFSLMITSFFYDYMYSHYLTNIETINLRLSTDYCEYDGKRYGHGETWEVGCLYNCVCEDAFTGSWRCVDK